MSDQPTTGFEPAAQPSRLSPTARWMAAIRARETERPDALFRDPLAAILAGDEGFALDRRMAELGDSANPAVEIRTRYFDDLLPRAARERGLAQVVLLAAGMDSRAVRLEWPAGTRLFELDRPELLALKERLLAGAGAVPRCDRRVVGVDLAGDWPPGLVAAGFEPKERSLWLAEGLLVYLPERAVEALLARVRDLAAPGSVLACDVVGRSLLTSPWMQTWLRRLEEHEFTWVFGDDDPEGLLRRFGWDASAVRIGDAAAHFGRWPYPPVPQGARGFPSSYLVTATRVAEP